MFQRIIEFIWPKPTPAWYEVIINIRSPLMIINDALNSVGFYVIITWAGWYLAETKLGRLLKDHLISLKQRIMREIPAGILVDLEDNNDGNGQIPISQQNIAQLLEMSGQDDLIGQQIVVARLLLDEQQVLNEPEPPLAFEYLDE